MTDEPVWMSHVAALRPFSGMRIKADRGGGGVNGLQRIGGTVVNSNYITRPCTYFLNIMPP